MVAVNKERTKPVKTVSGETNPPTVLHFRGKADATLCGEQGFKYGLPYKGATAYLSPERTDYIRCVKCIQLANGLNPGE